jgi:HK97 gp10 family phage protein
MPLRLSVEVSNLAVLQRLINQWAINQRAQLVRALGECGLVVQAEARQLILKGPKTGRIYVRRGRIRHRASAPGQPPASDTGTLVRSIVMDVDATKLTVSVGSNVKYAPYLELGTRRMKARPFLSLALENKRSTIVKIIAARMKQR